MAFIKNYCIFYLSHGLLIWNSNWHGKTRKREMATYPLNILHAILCNLCSNQGSIKQRTVSLNMMTDYTSSAIYKETIMSNIL